MSERVRLSRAKGWKMPPNTVKVDRATCWGNPFVVGKHGTAAECVELYRKLAAGLICLSTGNIQEQRTPERTWSLRALTCAAETSRAGAGHKVHPPRLLHPCTSLGAVCARLYSGIRPDSQAVHDEANRGIELAGLLREVDPLLMVDGIEVADEDDHSPVRVA